MIETAGQGAMPKRNSGSVRRRRKVQALRDAWRVVVSDWLQDATSWGIELGPAPGEAGCLCPQRVLAEFDLEAAEARDLVLA